MAGPEGTSTVRFAKETFVPRAHQGTEENSSERFFGGTNSLICACRIQNPDTLRAGRVGAAHGGAAGRDGAG